MAMNELPEVLLVDDATVFGPDGQDSRVGVMPGGLGSVAAGRTSYIRYDLTNNGLGDGAAAALRQRLQALEAERDHLKAELARIAAAIQAQQT